MANEHELKFVALGITNRCSHHCRFCYETAKLKAQDRRDGDLYTLMQIGDKLKESGVETIELVGGDPMEHPQIGVLTHYLHNIGLKVVILSNTHRAWHEVAPYVSALEWTVHGRPEYHDSFTKPGTYRTTLYRLKSFLAVKNGDQEVGITLNFTTAMVANLYNTVYELANNLRIDYIQLQRIGPFGGGASNAYKLKTSEIITIFQQIQRISNEFGLRIEVVDSFPLCILPEDLHKYTARCDWGYGTAYVDMYGNISRCAVNQIPIGNVLDMKMSLKQFWEHDANLRRFREKKYLPQKCQECKMLAKCGGGCPSSCGGCELSADELVIRMQS